ncbi:putative inositol-tetrakisphosphate 1-kinase 2-like [Capsicum annuum]|nr:putative inositol-tetrakisphosphate 1-kinase 2-like [Capsicum annuum]
MTNTPTPTASASCSTAKIGGNESDAPAMLSSDVMYAAEPVVDGNKMKISVPLNRMISKDGVVVSPVTIEVPIPRTMLLPESGKWPDHAQLLFQNRMNFKESGKPVRFLFYKDGEWSRFGARVVDLLSSAFVSGKAMYEVDIGSFKFIFDFYRMIAIDFVRGIEMFIGWMDDNNKWYFPKVVFEGSEDAASRKIELELRTTGNKSTGPELGKRKRESEENKGEKGECSSLHMKDQRVVDTQLLPPKWPRTRPLREEETLSQMIKGLILSFLSADATVTGVHQCLRMGPRFEAFQNTVETVRRARGDANVEYAWYGTSPQNVDCIMHSGFEMSMIPIGSHTSGLGIYLTPIHSPQLSEMMAETDENGERHLILCRAVLGKLEQIDFTSEQLSPSSEDFDSGVDNLTNPNLYVVWRSYMKTHILPVCIVSYKSELLMPGLLDGDPLAHNAWSTLLSKLTSWLPPPKVLELQTLYDSYKFIFWLAVQQRLATVDRLLRLGISVPPECAFCELHDETFHHLFFGCAITREIWSRLCVWLGFNRPVQDWNNEVRMACIKARKKNALAEIYCCVFAMTVDVIWRERNCIRFQQTRFASAKVLKEISLHVYVRGRETLKWQEMLQKLNTFPYSPESATVLAYIHFSLLQLWFVQLLLERLHLFVTKCSYLGVRANRIAGTTVLGKWGAYSSVVFPYH